MDQEFPFCLEQMPAMAIGLVDFVRSLRDLFQAIALHIAYYLARMRPFCVSPTK